MMVSRTPRPLSILHIAVGGGLVGAALVLIALGVAGMRGADPLTIHPAAHLVEAWVVAPLATAALISGVIQAHVTGRGLLRTGWVRVKLLLTAGMTAVVVFVLEPRLAASAQAALAGPHFSSIDHLPLAAAPAFALALVLINLTLGVSARGRHVRDADEPVGIGGRAPSGADDDG